MATKFDGVMKGLIFSNTIFLTGLGIHLYFVEQRFNSFSRRVDKEGCMSWIKTCSGGSYESCTSHVDVGEDNARIVLSRICGSTSTGLDSLSTKKLCDYIYTKYPQYVPAIDVPENVVTAETQQTDSSRT